MWSKNKWFIKEKFAKAIEIKDQNIYDFLILKVKKACSNNNDKHSINSMLRKFNSKPYRKVALKESYFLQVIEKLIRKGFPVMFKDGLVFKSIYFKSKRKKN